MKCPIATKFKRNGAVFPVHMKIFMLILYTVFFCAQVQKRCFYCEGTVHFLWGRGSWWDLIWWDFDSVSKI